MSKVTKVFNVYGMHCKSCELAIHHEVSKLKGISSVLADHKKSMVVVTFEDEVCTKDKIKKAIKNAGYSTKDNSVEKVLGLSIIVLAMMFLSNNSLFAYDTNAMLENASFIMLFIIGILTSFHCVGMCGGIMLTQTLYKNNTASLMYNLGRIISYTILGGIIGAIGSVFSLSMKAQGLIQIFAALFMVIAGLNMFGFKIFKNVNIKIPFLKNNCQKNSNRNPFIVGILNGFMPCGALQTMQLYSLSTGSFVLGALSMFVFSLGTVPLMLVFGYISSKLSKGFNNTIFKLSGIFIIVLGVSMASRGLALTGSNLGSVPTISQSKSELASVVDGYQDVVINVDRSGYTPSASYIQSDIPVRLTIKVDEVTGCNSPMYFPTFDQYLDLSKGDVVVEIEPNGKDIPFTCWMGMIRGNIQVVKKS